MDTALLFLINDSYSPFLDRLMWWVSAAGDLYIVWWAAGLAALIADRRRGRSVFASIVLSLVLTYVSVDLVIKPIVARPRPLDAHTEVRRLEVSWAGRAVRSVYSFPSGHAASAAAAAFVLARAYRRALVPLAAAVALTAYSRVYLGMHYPLDCAAGVVIGILCGEAAARLTSCPPSATLGRSGSGGG
ncbi:MAG: phosphatase PAP2 family protein [bacterium]|nr:phosphatase PAP2 family protein [bacterium]